MSRLQKLFRAFVPHAPPSSNPRQPQGCHGHRRSQEQTRCRPPTIRLPSPTSSNSPRPHGRKSRACWSSSGSGFRRRLRTTPLRFRPVTPSSTTCLEQRTRIARELARMNEAVQTQLSVAACCKFLDELVATSDLVSEAAALTLRGYLRYEL